MKIILTLIMPILISLTINAQESVKQSPESFGVEHLTEYLGLLPEDIGYRSDYTDPDSLRLGLIAKLMAEPLGMIDYAGSLKNAYAKNQPEILARILFNDLYLEGQEYDRFGAYQPTTAEIQNRYNLKYLDINLNQLLSIAASYLDVILPKSSELTFGRLSKSQKKFLLNEFIQVITIDKDEEFLTIEEADSLDELEEEYIEEFTSFASLINPDPINRAGIDCLRDILPAIQLLRSSLNSGSMTIAEYLKVVGEIPSGVSRETYLGNQSGWAIGGSGNDYYSGDYKFILDFGGDDIYDLSYDPAKPHGVIIIDLSGNDYYRQQSDFAIASGCLSAGLLLDFEGDDRYDGGSFSIGSGYFGFGLLYDADGDDRYDGDTHVQGAGTFGIGLLIDESGRDIYNAALYSQGFGHVRGMGMIYDVSGSDTYYAGGKYKDILRYDDHYLSLSQGFGYGLRPWMSGGIGSIIDLKGNDNYYSDIFAQGASYWWSLGMIYDSSGNDNYQCFQYGQGAATHMTLGILIDDFGSDVYFGKGLMQGCGHDYAAGILLDRNGNDTYTAYDLSQGAGSANGAGLLIDNNGDDRYFSKNRLNTQGYGNPRRNFGSIGLFIDLGGDDQYAGNGANDFYWQTKSKWGGGMDIILNPPDSLSDLLSGDEK